MKKLSLILKLLRYPLRPRIYNITNHIHIVGTASPQPSQYDPATDIYKIGPNATLLSAR